MTGRPPISPLSPYTTLSRSRSPPRARGDEISAPLNPHRGYGARHAVTQPPQQQAQPRSSDHPRLSGSCLDDLASRSPTHSPQHDRTRALVTPPAGSHFASLAAAEAGSRAAARRESDSAPSRYTFLTLASFPSLAASDATQHRRMQGLTSSSCSSASSTRGASGPSTLFPPCRLQASEAGWIAPTFPSALSRPSTRPHPPPRSRMSCCATATAPHRRRSPIHVPCESSRLECSLGR